MSSRVTHTILTLALAACGSGQKAQQQPLATEAPVETPPWTREAHGGEVLLSNVARSLRHWRLRRGSAVPRCWVRAPCDSV
jgi:hypothetical protein